MNESNSNSQKTYDLEERTAKLAERIIDLVKTLSINPINSRVVEQLVGSSGSLGANYCELEFVKRKRKRLNIG